MTAEELVVVMGALWRVETTAHAVWVKTAFYDPATDVSLFEAASAELGEALVKEHNEALLRRVGAL